MKTDDHGWQEHPQPLTGNYAISILARQSLPSLKPTPSNFSLFFIYLIIYLFIKRFYCSSNVKNYF